MFPQCSTWNIGEEVGCAQLKTATPTRTRQPNVARGTRVYIRIAPSSLVCMVPPIYVDAMFHVERSFSAILRAHSPILITHILLDGEFVPLTVNNVVQFSRILPAHHSISNSLVPLV